MWSTWRFGQNSRCLKDVKNDDDDDDGNKEAAKLMRASNVPMGTGVISVRNGLEATHKSHIPR